MKFWDIGKTGVTIQQRYIVLAMALIVIGYVVIIRANQASDNITRTERDQMLQTFRDYHQDLVDRTNRNEQGQIEIRQMVQQMQRDQQALAVREAEARGAKLALAASK